MGVRERCTNCEAICVHEEYSKNLIKLDFRYVQTNVVKKCFGVGEEMKRYKIWCVLVLSLAVGCGKAQNADGEQQIQVKKQEELLEQNETQELVYTFDYVGNIDDIAVTEEGQLYVISLQELEQSKEEMNGKELSVIKKPTQWIYEFASDGACICQGEMLYSPGKAMALEWSEGSLYMVIPGMNQMPMLYQVDDMASVYEMHEKAEQWPWQDLEKYDSYSAWMSQNKEVQNDILQEFRLLDTWTLQECYCFDTFSEINRLVFMEDKLYVYGVLTNPEENAFVQNLEFLENDMQSYQGEAIGYLDMKNPDAGITLLPMDGIPKDMIKLTEDTLGIYLAGKDTTSIWKYTPSKETWEQTAMAEVKSGGTAENSAVYREFATYKDGCFYVKNDNVVCYKQANGTEVELFESDGSVQGLKTDGTFLYYYSNEWSEKEVRRVEISELLGSKTE